MKSGIYWERMCCDCGTYFSVECVENQKIDEENKKRLEEKIKEHMAKYKHKKLF